MVNKYLPYVLGGIEGHIADISRELCKNPELSIDVLGASPDLNKPRVSKQENLSQNLRWHEVATWKTIANTPIAPHLSQKIIEMSASADIIHMHMPYPYGDYAYLRALAKSDTLKDIPLVVTYHADIVKQKEIKKLYKPVMNKFLSRAHTIIVSSPQLKENSSDLAPFKDKVEVIPFGCDTEFFKQYVVGDKRHEAQAYRAELSMSEHKRPLILFVGRLVYYKGIEVLLKALTQIDADLVIVGKGPLKTSLVQQSLELKLTHRVRFIDQLSQENLAKAYAAADVLCLPSIANSEAFGLVQIETHAAKTPTVASALTTGVSFATKHGVDGLLFESGNDKELARSLNMLFTHKDLLEKLSEQAFKRAQEVFSFEQMTQKTLEVYKHSIGFFKSHISS